MARQANQIKRSFELWGNIAEVTGIVSEDGESVTIKSLFVGDWMVGLKKAKPEDDPMISEAQTVLNNALTQRKARNAGIVSDLAGLDSSHTIVE